MGKEEEEEGEGGGLCSRCVASPTASCAPVARGCNGWFHPVCCGLALTEESAAAVGDFAYTCSLCLEAAAVVEGAKQPASKRTKRPSSKAAAAAEDAKGAPSPSGSGEGKKANSKRGAPSSVQGSGTGSSSGSKKKRHGKESKEGGGAGAAPARGGGLGRAAGPARDSAGMSDFADEAAIRAALRPDRSLEVDGELLEQPESLMVVEKFLGRKLAPPPDQPDGKAAAGKADGKGGAMAVEWYLCKWRGLSYLHASWEVAADIEAVDLAGKGKIRRYLASYPVRRDRHRGPPKDPVRAGTPPSCTPAPPFVRLRRRRQ